MHHQHYNPAADAHHHTQHQHQQQQHQHQHQHQHQNPQHQQHHQHQVLPQLPTQSHQVPPLHPSLIPLSQVDVPQQPQPLLIPMAYGGQPLPNHPSNNPYLNPPLHHQQQQQPPQQPIIVSNAIPSELKDPNRAMVNVARRGPWSPDEDNKLLELIRVFGASNWVRISQALGTRTPKQCRERYHQNLKPSLNRTPITQEEGELIEQLVLTCGKKWAEIARHLNGRSDNAVKNWWNGGANRRRRASAQLDTDQVPQQPKSLDTVPKVESVTQDDQKIAFNTSIFNRDEQQRQLLMGQAQPQQQQQQQQQQQPAQPQPPQHQQHQQQSQPQPQPQPHLHPHPPQQQPQQQQRSSSFDFRYPQPLLLLPQPPPLQHSNSGGGVYHSQDHIYSNIPRKQRKLIDEPISRRHSAAYIGTSSPLSRPPSISSRNSSLSHEFTGITSYNSSDNESVSRRSSIFGATSEFYQQHRKNNLSSHSNFNLSPSFQLQQHQQPLLVSGKRLSISSQLSMNNVSLPPLSPTTFPNSRQNSIHSERLPPLSLSITNTAGGGASLNIPLANIPSGIQSGASSGTTTPNVFKREFSLSKLDNKKAIESPFPSPSLNQVGQLLQLQLSQLQLQHPLQFSQGPIDDEKDANNTDRDSKGTATPTNTNPDGVLSKDEDDDKRRMSIANLLG